MKAKIKRNSKQSRVLKYIYTKKIQITSRDCPRSNNKCSMPECINDGCIKILN